MGICSKCQLRECETTFVWCRACRRAYDAARYQRLRPEMVAKARRQRHSVRAWMDTVKAMTPCADCGKRFPTYVMDWDHRPGATKLGSVSNLVHGGRRQQAEAEMRKCDLVCANCHRIRTHLRRIGAVRPLDRFFAVYWKPSRRPLPGR